MQEKFNLSLHNARAVIGFAIAFMAIGLLLELYLLDHYEGLFQLIPLICVSLNLLLAVYFLFRYNTLLMKVFKVSLVLNALSGFYGIFLHLKANYEFEKEISPGLDGMDLFMEMASGALPSLAPGSLILLSLIGYSYILLIKQKR